MLKILQLLSPMIGRVLEKAITDKDERARVQQQLESQLLANIGELHAAAAGIITAEANSKWALAAVWRPTLMLVFVFIIFNNYVLAPYVALISGVDVAVVIPPQMWELLKIGVGGYIVGRSGEKMVTNYINNKG